MSFELSNSLTDLAYRIKTEHEAVSASLKQSVAHAIAAGELLLEAKAQLGHGQWLPWLQENCGVSPRSAQGYMRVARHRDELETNTQGLAYLTVEGALKALAAPKADVPESFDQLFADITGDLSQCQETIADFRRMVECQGDKALALCILAPAWDEVGDALRFIGERLERALDSADNAADCSRVISASDALIQLAADVRLRSERYCGILLAEAA